MRPEKLYLIDMLDAADAIQRFIRPVDKADFLLDELRQSGVLQKLIVIGEAAARLPQDFRQKHVDIDWEDVIGFRNIAVHQYFSIVWDIVWNTASYDVPELHTKIAHILTTEFPDS